MVSKWTGNSTQTSCLQSLHTFSEIFRTLLGNFISCRKCNSEKVFLGIMQWRSVLFEPSGIGIPFICTKKRRNASLDSRSAIAFWESFILAWLRSKNCRFLHLHIANKSVSSIGPLTINPPIEFCFSNGRWVSIVPACCNSTTVASWILLCLFSNSLSSLSNVWYISE